MNVQRKVIGQPAAKIHRGTIVSGGRLQIPAGIRRELGLKDGDSVTFEVIDGELRVVPYREVIRRVQEMLRPYRREGVSVVDELIAERRAEAERE